MIGPLINPRSLRRTALGLVLVAAASLTAGLPTPASGGACSATSPPPTYSPPWQLINRSCGGPQPDTLNLCSTDTIRWCADLILYTGPDGSTAYAYADRYDCLACNGGGGPGGAGGPIEH